jgi:hypothetical protein
MSESLLKIVAVLFAAVALGATAAPTRGFAHGASSGAVGPSSGVSPQPSSPGVAGHSGSPSAVGKGGPQGSPTALGKDALPTRAGAPPRDPPSSGWQQQLGHRYHGQGGPGVVTQTCNPAYYDCGH